MAPDWDDTFSFVRGSGNDAGEFLFVMVVDELAQRNSPHSVLQSRDRHDVWKPIAPLKWSVAAIVNIRHGSEDRFLAIGDMGQTALWDGQVVAHGQIETGRGVPKDLGRIRSAVVIDGEAYAVGMGRTVYVGGRGSWRAMDDGVRRTARSADVVGFEAVAGFSSSEVYAAGWHGELWQFNGRSWSARDLPTNSVVTGLSCADDGHVYGIGRNGLLFRGREEAWELIEQDVTIEDFWGIADFNGSVYVSTMRAVYRWDGRSLVLEDFGDDLPATCYGLAASRGGLLSIGPKDVMYKVGNAWTRLA